MAGICGKDTAPELAVRRFLHRAGLRFRLHARLPGKPDLVFPRYRVALFVHGCFWHRHPGCRYTTTPASNAAFWRQKFAENVSRDARVQRQLETLGWQVHVVWACQLSERELGALVATIRAGVVGASRDGDER